MQLSDKVQVQAARIVAIEYLSYGAKTSGKIIQKLKSKAFAAHIIKEAIASLQADDYIKDEAIVQSYWKRRTGAKRESVHAFCRRMLRLGVNQGILDKFTEEHPAYETDAETIREYLQARFSGELDELKLLERVDSERPKLIQKIIRNAAGHGYSHQCILDGLRSCAILLHA